MENWFNKPLIVYLMMMIIGGGFLPRLVDGDSLWRPGSASIYTQARTARVGDVVTIYVSESTSAAQEAGTKTSKSSKVGMDIVEKFQFQGGDDYSGAGQTSRKSNVRTVITAMVIDVMDNGNLIVEGDHEVKVNDETETIRIRGIVRPQDISPQNTVYSYQLARVQFSLKGSGVVGAKQTPGFLSKAFGWLF